MSKKVGVVGVGYTGFSSVTPDVSWKEIMFQAASRAYSDAGIDPRKDVDSFITCAEDYWEGFSIFDEFVPDQLGSVLRPTCTVTADGLYGLINGYMQILTGLMDIVVVEAHSKISDLLTYNDVLSFAIDPVFNRPLIDLGAHPYYIAGMEMKRYMNETGTTEGQCAEVVRKNKLNAMSNPSAGYEAKINIEDVLSSEELFAPLKRLDISPLADGCVVFVLASEDAAKKLAHDPIWIKGVGWASETSWLENKEWGRAVYAELAKFSYKELQHLEALGLCRRGDAGKSVEEGAFDVDGVLPVNPSGGLLGVGNTIEASGLQKALEVILQLRKDAGGRQLQDVECGLAQSWRGVPTTSGAVAIFEA
jgi:acetyl-CoA C-acetyltransferase